MWTWSCIFIQHSLAFATPLCCAIFPQRRCVHSSSSSSTSPSSPGLEATPHCPPLLPLPQLHISIPAWAGAKAAAWTNHDSSLLQQGTVEDDTAQRVWLYTSSILILTVEPLFIASDGYIYIYIYIYILYMFVGWIHTPFNIIWFYYLHHLVQSMFRNETNFSIKESSSVCSKPDLLIPIITLH